MTVVVDLGCADRPEFDAFSLPALADAYKPDIIYGFDPSPTLPVRKRKVNGVPVKLVRKAAWTYDGTISFDDTWLHGGARRIGVGPSDPSLGRIGTIGIGDLTAECFDFARWLRAHGPAVVKMDIEGAEYGLLEHLLDTRTAGLMSELLIEWHDTPDEKLLRRLKRAGVPVKAWWM